MEMEVVKNNIKKIKNYNKIHTTLNPAVNKGKAKKASRTRKFKISSYLISIRRDKPCIS